jgi:hypothetical protein
MIRSVVAAALIAVGLTPCATPTADYGHSSIRSTRCRGCAGSAGHSPVSSSQSSPQQCSHMGISSQTSRAV